MKPYWGSGGIAPRILGLGTRWRWRVSFTPRPLYPKGKSPWYPLDRSLSEHGGEEKNSQLLQGLELTIIQPVPQPCTTELSRLSLLWGKKMNYKCLKPKWLWNYFEFRNLK
jgi:hypothetical protein